MIFFYQPKMKYNILSTTKVHIETQLRQFCAQSSFSTISSYHSCNHFDSCILIQLPPIEIQVCSHRSYVFTKQFNKRSRNLRFRIASFVFFSCYVSLTKIKWPCSSFLLNALIACWIWQWEKFILRLYLERLHLMYLSSYFQAHKFISFILKLRFNDIKWPSEGCGTLL